MPDQTPDKDAADDLASSTLTARMSWSSAEIAALRNLLADEERRRVHLCEVMDAENTRIINEKIAAESEIAALRSRLEWQPIETARKDEYAIICDARGEIWLAAYYPENSGANWRGPNSEVYDDVIGWMKLPAVLSKGNIE